MKNSNFSDLIYKIIGKPERWHDDYIDLMHQILDETDSFDDPENFSELAEGEQLLSRISGTNGALKAFYTLLDNNRFQMIILDQDLTPIFHNQSANNLYAFLCTTATSDNKPHSLKPSLLQKLKLTIDKSKQQSLATREHLSAIDYKSNDGEQLYLRSIQRQPSVGQTEFFYVIMMVDQAHAQSALNPELVALYALTAKEQMVLSNLILGKSIKKIAEQSFVTENTVKTHIKALFRKTGTNSQADIVRMVLTHESQVLDSYFDTNPGAFSTDLAEDQDLSVSIGNDQIITYREYGPKNGDPIIVCHNGFGCRISIPSNHKEVCERFNKRIIIPDRPGFGKSTYCKSHPESWNQQLDEFVNALQLKSFDLIGSVLGCPLAIRYAAHADDRLKRLILTSPAYINHKKDAEHLRGIFVPSVRLVRTSKRFAREIYVLWLKSITLNLSTHYRSMVDQSLGDNEQNVGGDKDRFLDSLVDAFKEGISSGLEGISHEMVYCLSPMKLDLTKIKNPVHIWYGTQDARISQEGAEHLASQFPNATVYVEAGYSEHIYHGLFEKIIATSCGEPKTH